MTAARLQLVHAVERLIQEELAPRTVRCRLRQDGVAIQLDADGLARISGEHGAGLRARVAELLAGHGHSQPLRYEPYRMGSAFHRPAGHG